MNFGLGLGLPLAPLYEPRGGGGGGGTGLITAAAIAGDMNDVATTTVSPLVTAGPPATTIPLPTNGWVLALTFSSDPGVIDPTKITVNINRPGFTNGVAVTKTDVAYGTMELRRAWPNNTLMLGTGTTRYVVLDNQIHAPDTISSIGISAGFYTSSPVIVIGPGIITRNDSLPYPIPIVRPLTQPFQRVGAGGTVTFEVTGVHEYAANGQQFDSVEAWIHDANGNDGAHVLQAQMTRSALTPAPGRLPSGFPVPSYSMTLSAAGLVNGQGEIRYKVYPQYGDQPWTSVTAAGANPNPGYTMTFPAIELPVAGLPTYVDGDNSHAEAYAWVNGDGTGLTGTSTAGVTLQNADPGPTNSYVSIAAAAAAIKLFNATTTGVTTFDGTNQKRATAHNDTSGGVVVLRDVTGTGVGDYSTGYSVGSAVTTSGFLPLVIRRGAGGSSASPGATSVNCRLCGVTRANASPASVIVGPKVKYDGISFDGRCGTTLQNNCADTNTAAPTTLAAATGFVLLQDCDIYELTGAGKPCLYRSGWRYDLRVNHDNAGSSDAMGGAYAQNFNCLVQSVGSLYTNANNNGINCGVIAGVWIQAGIVQTNTGPPTIPAINSLRQQVFYNVRVDSSTTFNNAPVNLGSGAPINGLGICGLMVRKNNTTTAVGSVKLFGDGAHLIGRNIVVQHISVDSGAQDGGGRFNWSYQDMGYIQVRRDSTIKFGAMDNYNIKTDGFQAPTTPATAGDGTATTGTRYYYGDIVQDGSNNWYHHLELVDPNGVGEDLGVVFATGDLTNPAKWEALPGIIGTSVYGRQPLRTGNWRTTYMVRGLGTITCGSAGTPAPGDATGFFGMTWCRGGIYNATYATMFKRRSAGSAGSGFTDWGDYRPQSIASGDAANSDLLNRVPAGKAVTPFDIVGVAYLNDGTDSAGAYQHA